MVRVRVQWTSNFAAGLLMQGNVWTNLPQEEDSHGECESGCVIRFEANFNLQGESDILCNKEDIKAA